MIDFLYAEINIIGIILLLLFLNNMNRNKQKTLSIDQYLFNACLIMNIMIFVFDTGMWLIDGNSQEGLIYANYAMTMLYYISNPLICLLWLLYTDYKIYESKEGILKRIGFYIIPGALSTTLSILSLSTGWFFTIDSNNNYMRGPFFYIMALISLLYLVVSFVLSLRDVIRNGWEENKNMNIHLVLFPVGIILASVVQILFFGISIIWVSAMIAFASIYINIQNGEITTDHLTGLYNRRRLDEHFQRRIKMKKANDILFAIMIDLDDFKKINDNYGHETGDQALMEMAELLRQVCKGSDDFIARMGGDEFIILGERTQMEEVKNLQEKIILATKNFNLNNKLKYNLKPSMGLAIYDKHDTANTFFAAADRLMYQNKMERKLAT